MRERKRGRGLIALLGSAGLTLLIGGAALADTAPNNCGEPSMTTGVQFLTVQSAQNLTLTAQPDGSFTADVLVRVFCTSGTVDIGEVAGSQIRISTTVPNTTVNGLNATSLGGATIDVPSGIATLHLRSTDPGLAAGQWFARVGSDTLLVSLAFSQTIAPGDSPTQTGRIFAQTPELDSLLLYGAGAIGFASYALTRRRARGRA